MELEDRQIGEVVKELLKKNSLGDARLRLTVTRGKAGAEGMEPTALLTAADLVPYPEEYYQKGMTAAVEDQQKLNPYDVQAGHKTLNYFSRLMALRTANQRGAGEAMLFDVHNYLQSGSVSNVFVVKDGVILTPPTQEELLDEGVAGRTPYPRSAVLPGVTRGTVLELAERLGIKMQVSAIDIEGMLGGNELFITNSIMGVMPVCRIERKAIGEDRPGEITKKLMTGYAEWTIDGIGE
jgi:branched-chain amino acid aminotransferase